MHFHCTAGLKHECVNEGGGSMWKDVVLGQTLTLTPPSGGVEGYQDGC